MENSNKKSAKRKSANAVITTKRIIFRYNVFMGGIPHKTSLKRSDAMWYIWRKKYTVKRVKHDTIVTRR